MQVGAVAVVAVAVVVVWNQSVFAEYSYIEVDNVIVAYHFCSDQSQSRLSCFIFQPPEQSEQPIILPTLVSSCQREC